MPIKAGFLDSPCFPVRKAYQASHGLPGSAMTKRNMKPAIEQFDFGLRLVIPVAAPPRPWIAGRSLLGNDHDASELTLHLALDPILFVRRGIDRLQRQARFVHQKIIAIEPVPRCLLAVKGWGSVCCERLSTMH